MKIFSLVCVLSLGLWLAGCGGTTGKSAISSQNTFQLDGVTYEMLDSADTLVSTGTNVSGRGNIRLVSQLPGGTKKNRVSFDVTLQEEGTLVVYLNAKSDLTAGVALELQRKNGRLSRAHLNSAVSEAKPILSIWGMDATKTMRVSFEVHNDESPAHILVKVNDELKFNSDNEGHQGDSKDAFLGFSLSGAKIERVSVEKGSH